MAEQKKSPEGKRWLILSEKPSVATDIAKALGGFEKLGEYYESKDYVITWAVGHLLELLAPEEIDQKYKRWLLQDLPIIPENFEYKPKATGRYGDRIKVIKSLFKRDDVAGVINACDAAREGELIFIEIYDYCGRKLPVRRLWLQSMTPDSIRQEFTRLKDGADFEPLGAAARCRAESDWLIGMNGTRAFTRRLRSRTQRGGSWSVGRVQTPTLGLLVEREMSILKHRPEDYWTVEARFSTSTHEYSGEWFDPAFKKVQVAEDEDDKARDNRIFDKKRLDELIATLHSSGGDAHAKESRRNSNEGAPQLFDLTSLQREANGKHSLSARRTLEAAQRLYERHKMLTYPRTDSKYLPNEYRKVTRELLTKLQSDSGAPAGLQGIAARLLSKGLLNENRIFDDNKVSDHFAIIPTGDFDTSKLEGDDLRVFELVLKRFVAAFMEPAVWAHVERITTLGKENFRTRVKSLEKPGWREVFGKDSDEEGQLPPLKDGVPNGESKVTFEEVTAEAKKTKPPPRLSEAALLSRMETCGRTVENEEVAEALREKGIGTPATRAEIIEKLISTEYVARSGRQLRATAKGIRLLDVLSRVPVEGLSSVELTGDMERDLKRLEKGEGSREVFMQKMVEYTKDIVEKARGFDYDAIYSKGETLGKCPIHPTSDVRETFWAYKCQEKDCAFIIWKEKNGRYIDSSLVKDVLAATQSGDGGLSPVGPFEFMNSAGLPFENFVRIKDNGLFLCEADGKVMETSKADMNVIHEEFFQDSFLGQPGRLFETETAYFFEFGASSEPAAAENDSDDKTAKKSKKKTAKKPKAAKKIQARMPKLLCGHPMPREEFIKFIREGQTSAITDFKSKKGRPFAAALHLKENGNFEFKFESRKKLLGEDDKPKKKAAPKARGKAKIVKKGKGAGGIVEAPDDGADPDNPPF